MRVGELLEKLKASNITLRLVDGQLKVKAPVGALTPDIKQALQENKQAILDLLGNASQPKLPAIVPVAEADWYEVSHAQKQLWLVNHYKSAKTSYNISGVFSVEGELDIALFERAVYQLASRHEILRTTFITIEGEPKQRISEKPEINLETFDLVNENDATGKLDQIIKDDSDALFDLATGPLWRLKFVRLGENKHYIIINMHHIISDAWSMNVIFNEVLTNYSALRSDNNYSLPPLNIQYKDYAAWQLSLLKGDYLKETEAYWLNQFKGKSTVLDLPLDYTRPQGKTFEGRSVDITFDEELTGRIEKFAKAHKASSFILLVAAVKSLLYRYTGQSEIVVGTTTSGRTNYDLESQIGYYINTLALRSTVNGEDSFETLLNQVNRNTLQAFKHELYPFDKLVETLQLNPDAGRSPLFDVLVEFVDMDEGAQTNPDEDLIIQPVNGQNTISKFDLSFRFIKSGQRLTFYLEYKTALFKEDKAQMISTHFQQLLKTVIEDSSISVQSLDYFSSGEIQKLQAFECGERALIGEETVVDSFKAQVRKTPDADAVLFGNVKLTYKELDEKSDQLAARLIEQYEEGKKPVVALLMDPSELLLIGMWGILKANAVVLPLSTNQPLTRTAFYLADAQVDLVITHSDFMFDLPEDFKGEIMALDIELDTFKNTLPELIYHHDDLAYVIYTSGSTGTPKGVAVAHKSLTNYLKWANNYYFEGKSGFNFPLFTSVSFDLTFTSIFSTLTRGDAVVISPEKEVGVLLREMFDPENSRVQAVKMTPSHVSLLGGLQLTKTKVSHVILGGEEVRQSHYDFLKQLNSDIKIYNEYGPTETTIGCTVKLMSDDQDILSIGRQIVNTSIYILDSTMNRVPVGVEGEMYIGGDCLAKGYLNNPSLSENSFLPNPFKPGERLYKTGDYARWSPLGELLFSGRKDHQVKIRGNRIELEEIRQAILKYETIDEAVVIAKTDENQDKQLVAYYLSKNDQDSSEIAKHLRDLLPTYMVPNFLMQIEELPINNNGKLDTKALPDPFAVHGTTQKKAWQPAGPAETKLANIWKEVLNLDVVGAEDEFFQLGGDSLRATQMVVRIRQELGAPIELENIFDHSTIERLAAFVGSLAGEVHDTIPALEKQDLYEVSYAQRRLWILHTLGDAQTPYNLPGACIFKGGFDRSVFEQAIRFVIQRHEILRTTFVVVDGEPKQKIADHVNFDLAYTELPEGESQKNELDQLLEEFAYTRFDLENGPVFRAKLVGLSPERCCLFFVIHHIISDGWSMQVLVNEIAQVYQAMLNQMTPDLPPLRIQYKDYADWQRKQLSSQEFEAKNYWLDVFKQPIPVLDLPTDYLRPPIKTFEGKLFTEVIAAPFSDKLKELSQAHNTTLFTLLLSSVYGLLKYYSGQQDIIIGTPVAGRNHLELENQLGCFVNTLALRLDFDKNTSFNDLLDGVQSITRNAFKHQIYPFDELVDQLELDKDLSHSTLFDVMVQLQNEKGILSHEEYDDVLLMENYDVDFKYTKFDLSFNFRESHEGLVIEVEYNTDLFKSTTIERMVNHYTNLLTAVVEDSSLALEDIPFMNSSEEELVLKGFNTTSQPYPERLTLHQIFENQVDKSPNDIAVIFEDKQLTYSELNSAANQFAHHLLERFQVEEEDLVAVVLERSENMMIALLGILKAGAVYVPIDPEYPAERLEFIIQDTQAKAIVVDERKVLADKQLTLSNVISFAEDHAAISGANTENPNLTCAPNRLAYAIYTSGSTGRPKGTLIEHAGVVNRIDWMWKYCGFNTNDVIFQKTPYVFDVSVWEIFMTLCYGARLVLCKRETIYDPEQIADLIHKHKITTLHFVPTMLKIWLESIGGSDEVKLSSLKRVIASGEALLPEMVAKFYKIFDIPLHNLYGPTEASVDVSAYDTVSTDSIVPIGKPIANIRLYILDENKKPLPVGVNGGLYISGVGVARGYLNRPDLTREKFIDNPFAEPGYEKLYRTGDIAKWLPDGNIQLAGREDDQVKIKGFRIELGEISNVLLSHDGVKEALVVVKEDTQGEKYLAAYYIPKSEQEIDFIDFLRNKVPAYMVPAYFIPMESFPFTPNGKLDTRKLPAPAESIEEPQSEVYENELQECLAAVWKSVLGRKKITIDENFFSIGGDSIKSIQVVAKLHELKYKISTQDIFQFPTIRELSRVVSVKEGFADQSTVKGRVPLSPVQTQFFEKAKKHSNHYNQALMITSEQRMDKQVISTIFKKLIAHHDALRMSFKTRNNKIVQYNHALSYPLHIEEHDLQNSQSPQSELTAIAEELQASIDLAKGPLLKLGLFHMPDGDRLLMAIHHLVMDVVSWFILLGDLELLYRQHQEGSKLMLPPKDDSFKKWCERMADHAKNGLLPEERNYWKTLASKPLSHITLDFSDETNMNKDEQRENFRLSKEETENLTTKVGKAFNTEINDILLAALSLAVYRHFGLSQVAVAMESHGREELFSDININRTIGWFTNIYPVVLEVNDANDLSRYIKNIKEQMRHIPNKGLGYGLARYLAPEEAPENQWDIKPQMSFNYLGQMDAAVDNWSFGIASESYGATQSPENERDYVLEVTGAITDGELDMAVIYGARQFKPETMNLFMKHYQEALTEIIALCTEKKSTDITPSDLGYKNISMEQLENFFN
ncbi:amino acid adenylation domain-containing protein [Fulvivirga sp. 29W222]|uniref:Amino acid adenylation domain-containing protein n=1 Tax=Fulvivirga marina TaxID=2494733 RepID=A0A937KDZ2_9BACT|nr:non-ribosomal peptide synthetase [Fulvivirga marina]MBL6449162.1 amino acid adenylation domain-containing protein [Fulvivirga marina]